MSHLMVNFLCYLCELIKNFREKTNAECSSCFPEIRMFAKKSLNTTQTDLSIDLSRRVWNFIRISLTQPTFFTLLLFYICSLNFKFWAHKIVKKFGIFNDFLNVLKLKQNLKILRITVFSSQHNCANLILLALYFTLKKTKTRVEK